jgi:hypothetical protein
MENRFFVEAKSFHFSLVKGLAELRVEEKRKGFLGAAVLGTRCIAWLLLMVEEVLRNPGIEDFVNSFKIPCLERLQ